MSGMRDMEEIRRRLRALCSVPGGETFPATVQEVDADRRTCRVEAEGVAYDDVLLHAVADAGRKGFCFLPAVGSVVLVSRIGSSNELYVAMFSEVDEVRLSIGDSAFTVTADGFAACRGDSGLRATLERLLDALCALTVTTGVGPSGTPVNATDFKNIKEDLKNYLIG